MTKGAKMITEPRVKTPAKSSEAHSTSELMARISKLQAELESVFESRTPVIAEALEATVEGVRRSLAGSAKPTESSVLSSVVDELGQVVARKLQDKFSVEDSFRLAKMRGETAKLDILNQVGPMLTLQQAAAVLSVSKQAVHKRLQNQSLFGIKYQEEIRIPAWQIRDAEVVPGIGRVLKNLDTTDWGKLLFLHTTSMQLQDRKPKDLILEGKGDLVAQLAAEFGEQGAQ
jgi:hypothetical protein